jgi:phage terminase large subunit GpA-like protein
VRWTQEEMDAVKPPEKITITEFACSHRELGKLSAVTGLYNIKMTPFFGPIMDRCGSPDVDEQSLVANTQGGKTVALVENVSAYYLKQDPSSVMVCLADQDTSNYVATTKIAAMFKDSPKLMGLYHKDKFTNKFAETPNGGRIDFAWASSVTKIATKPVRIVIGDEVNKPGYSLTSEEASRMSLLKERTKSYPAGFFKHIFVSTPTTPTGNIHKLMDAADIVTDWQVECPHCGIFQIIRWSSEYAYGFPDGTYRDDKGVHRAIGRVVWEGGRNATKAQIKKTARYECGTCKGLWTCAQKNKAVGRGKEVYRTEPVGDERKYSSHVNRIYSLFDSGRLEYLINEWVAIFKTNKDEQIGELQGFVNGALAEPFSTVIRLDNQTEDKVLKARVDLAQQTVPEEAVALVAYIDCQKYDFWFCVRAFSSNSASWLIHYGRIDTWEAVGLLLFESRYPQIGTDKKMRIWRAGVDTGGGEGRYEVESMTEIAYQWLRKNQVGKGCRVWGTKGASDGFPGAEAIRVGKPFDRTPSGKTLDGGLQIIHLDTFKLKTRFHVRLKSAIEREDTGQPAYLNKDVKPDYASQILAEELKLNDKGVEVWSQIGSRANHLFDCEVGCLALADPEWPGGGVNLVSKEAIAVEKQKAVRRVRSRGNRAD